MEYEDSYLDSLYEDRFELPSYAEPSYDEEPYPDDEESDWFDPDTYGYAGEAWVIAGDDDDE